MSGAPSLLRQAESVRNQAFSKTYGDLHRGQRLDAYCAAFVRWCFSSVGKPLPVVSHPEYYRKIGLSFVGVENTADGLAGQPVGEVVPEGMMAGDILLFRNTYGAYPFGTITHVGLAANSQGMMYDAGSGSIVHFRSVKTFPNLLVEVRRPLFLGGISVSKPSASGLPHRMEETATRIHYRGGQVSAKREGRAVRDLDVVLHADGRCVVNGLAVQSGVVSLVIHDVSGAVYKMHKHHGHAMMSGASTIAIALHNGLLEVAYVDRSGAHIGAGAGSASGGGTSATGGSGSGSGGSSADHDMWVQSRGRSHAGARAGSRAGTRAGGGDTATKAGKPSTFGSIAQKISGVGSAALAHVAQQVGVEMHPLKPTSVELMIMH